MQDMEGFNGEQIKQLEGVVSKIVTPLHESVITQINALDTRMEHGFAALAEDIADAREETIELGSEFTEYRIEAHETSISLHAEIRSIRTSAEELRVSTKNSAGFTKEIDHVMDRIRAIEEHLNIEPKVAVCVLGTDIWRFNYSHNQQETHSVSCHLNRNALGHCSTDSIEQVSFVSP